LISLMRMKKGNEGKLKSIVKAQHPHGLDLQVSMRL